MFNLRRMLEGMGAQANPFDGGKTFASVNRKPKQVVGRSGGGFIPRNPKVNVGRLESQGGQSYDNVMTNRMVDRGQLPQSRAEIYQQPQLGVSNFGGYGQANYAGAEDAPQPAVQFQPLELGYNMQGDGGALLQGGQSYQTGQLTRPGASLQGLQGRDTGDYRRFIGY